MVSGSVIETALEQKDFFESILVYTIRNWRRQDRLAYLKLVNYF